MKQVSYKCQGRETSEMKVNPLIFFGFQKPEMPDDKDITNEWNTNESLLKRGKSKK